MIASAAGRKGQPLPSFWRKVPSAALSKKGTI